MQEPSVQSQIGKIPWRRAWQPTPVFLPGEFHGQRSLAGYSPSRVGLDWAEKSTSLGRNQPVWLRLTLRTAPELFLQGPLPAASPHQGTQGKRPSCGRDFCHWDFSFSIPSTTLKPLPGFLSSVRNSWPRKCSAEGVSMDLGSRLAWDQMWAYLLAL